MESTLSPPRSNIQTTNILEEAQMENEVARIGVKGERTKPNKLEWSNRRVFLLRKQKISNGERPAKRGALGERTGTNKLKWSSFSQILLRKSIKSMKAPPPAAARSAFRSFFPILFRNKAEIEQLANEKAEFEPIGMSEMGNLRAIWLKDAQFELLLNQRNVSPICHAPARSNVWDWETQIEKLERRTNLAKAAHLENELAESSCFRGRLP